MNRVPYKQTWEMLIQMKENLYGDVLGVSFFKDFSEGRGDSLVGQKMYYGHLKKFTDEEIAARDRSICVETERIEFEEELITACNCGTQPAGVCDVFLERAKCVLGE